MDLIAIVKPDLAAKARKRRIEIEKEIATVEDFSGYLTEEGKALHSKCLKVIESSLSSHIEIR
jgi:hypothetical protein